MFNLPGLHSHFDSLRPWNAPEDIGRVGKGDNSIKFSMDNQNLNVSGKSRVVILQFDSVNLNKDISWA